MSDEEIAAEFGHLSSCDPNVEAALCLEEALDTTRNVAETIQASHADCRALSEDDMGECARELKTAHRLLDHVLGIPAAPNVIKTTPEFAL